MAEDCEFGEVLPDMLRDRLVCGINNARIQRCLLQESNLQFEDAMKVARAMETADKNSTKLRSPWNKVRRRRSTAHRVEPACLNHGVFVVWGCTHQVPAGSRRQNAGNARKSVTWLEHARANQYKEHQAPKRPRIE